MKKLSIISTIVLMLVGNVSIGQGLKVRYDFNTDMFKFYQTKPGKPDKLVSYPVLGKNELIHLEVINFNKFVYSANCTFTSAVESDESNISFMNLLAPMIIPGTSQSFFTSLGGTTPTGGGTRGQGMGVLSSRSAQTALNDITDSYTQLATMESTVRNIDYAIKKLNELRFNPYLPTDTIKALTDHIVSSIFQKEHVRTADFTDAIVALNKDYQKYSSDLSVAASRFLSEYDEYAAQHVDERFDGIELKDFVQNLSRQLSESQGIMGPDDITQRMNTLENLYTMIKVTNFKFNASHMAEGDKITLKISFYENPKDDSVYSMAALNKLDTLNEVRVKEIKIRTKDLKFSQSIGFGFPFYSINQSFINRDSIITAVEGNNYSPNLAGYLNFYPYRGRSFNVGGTFGVGVPLTERGTNFSMFLGASALFGSQGRIVVHAGGTLGQVKILDQGYMEGDRLGSLTQKVPTTTSWDLGGFFGVSFTINSSTSSSGSGT